VTSETRRIRGRASDASTAADTNVEARKPKAEWRKLLPSAAYSVLFDALGPPFSSPLDKEKRQGTFVCAACYLPLFNSSAKFDGTGWPSFYAPIAGRVATKRDYWLVLPRTEYHCIRCGGHQGMSSTTARHRPDGAGATTAWR
jgi:peptide-methionine (R)-S-oxide reductase